MSLDSLYQSFLNCFILNVWFNTNAFYEYCKYFRVGSICFWIVDYEKKKELAPSLTYNSYLNVTFSDSFFIKLITCPICLSFWINIICCMFNSNWSMFFVNCWLSLSLYYISTALSKVNLGKTHE